MSNYHLSALMLVEQENQELRELVARLRGELLEARGTLTLTPVLPETEAIALLQDELKEAKKEVRDLAAMLRSYQRGHHSARRGVRR